MLVKKCLADKARKNHQVFVSEVEEQIRDLQQAGAQVLLAFWGTLNENNSLFAEVYFFAPQYCLQLRRNDSVVSKVNAVALGQCRTRNIIGHLVGNQRGGNLYPLQTKNQRRSSMRSRL